MSNNKHRWDMTIGIEALFNKSSGINATKDYQDMISGMVEMARQAGHQIDQALLTKAGNFDKRKWKQGQEWLKGIKGFDASATYDTRTNKITSARASMLSKRGDFNITRTFRQGAKGLEQQTETVTTAYNNIEQEYNRVYGELIKATKQVFQLQRQEVDETSERYQNLINYVDKLEKKITEMNTEQAQTFGIKDGMLQGEDPVAANQRRNEHSYRSTKDDISRQKMTDAETKLANTTKEWYSARVQLKKMLVANTQEKSTFSAEELNNQRQYIAGLATTKDEQAEIYKQLGGNIKESEKLNKVEREGNYQLNQQNKILNQSTSILDKIKTSFGGILKGVVQAGISWKLFAGITRTLSESIEIVKDLDSAMVDLQMATGQSKEEVRSLLVEYNKIGKDLGATTTEVAKSADTWLRMGYNQQDTNTLIKNSMVLSKVGQLDSAEATKYLVSAMKGFNIEASDSISIVDKLSAVDLESVTYCLKQYSCVYYVNSIYFSLNCWQSLKSIKLQHKIEQI